MVRASQAPGEADPPKEKGEAMRTEPAGNITRRDLVLGGAAAVGAAALANVGDIPTARAEGAAEGAAADQGHVDYEVYNTDVCIIGGGLAGVAAAIAAVDAGKDVVVIEKGPHGFGGPAGYNWDQFVNFVRDDLPWRESTDFVLNELTNQAIEKNSYEHWMGEDRNLMVRDVNLGYGLLDRDPDTGEIKPLLDFPTIYGIYRGFSRHQLDAMGDLGVKILDQTMATDIAVQDGVCCGVMGLHIPTGSFRVVRSKATVCCTGASTWMYGWNTCGARTINSPDNTGDIDAAAFRHGCALEGNEFFQCDLLNIEPRGIACSFQSGIGADSGCCEYICDKDGNYFFRGMDYSTLNKITFTQAIARCIAEGGGTENGGVYVDFSSPEAFGAIGETYQRNIELWKEVFGIDVEGTKLEVCLEAYEHAGNPVADGDLMVEGIAGLFHARGGGFSGAQGGSTVNVAPRNGSYAMSRAVAYIDQAQVPALDEATVLAEHARLHELFGRTGGKRPQQVRRMIQRACYQACQPARPASEIEAGIAELARIRAEEMPAMTLGDRSHVFNTDWKCAIENYNLLDLAEAAARSAAFREETRGHMFRPEFPDTDDQNWLCNVHARYSDGVITCEKAPVVTVED